MRWGACMLSQATHAAIRPHTLTTELGGVPCAHGEKLLLGKQTSISRGARVAMAVSVRMVKGQTLGAERNTLRVALQVSPLHAVRTGHRTRATSYYVSWWIEAVIGLRQWHSPVTHDAREF